MNAQGPLTSSVMELRRLLAQSPAFQKRVATSTVPADDKIFMYDFEDNPTTLKNLRPFAVIWPSQDFEIGVYAGGAQNYLKVNSAGLILILCDLDRVPGDRTASAADFIGWLDAVIMDLMNLNGQDGYLPINKIAFQQPPARNSTKDEAAGGAYWHVSLLITWNQ
jgi:hypothetical protein